jgi:preprotein translocase subunit SecD
MKDHTRNQAAGIVAVLVALTLCAGCSSGPEYVSLEIRLVEETPAEDLTAMTMRVWGDETTYYAHDEVLMDDKDVTAAMVITKDDGAPAIRLVFAGEGREKLLRLTQRNLGRRLGVVVGGHLQCAPAIEAPNDSGILIVTGHMLEPAARRCSQALTRAAAERSRSPRALEEQARGSRKPPA